MVILSNIVFTITEILMLSCLYKEFIKFKGDKLSKIISLDPTILTLGSSNPVVFPMLPNNPPQSPSDDCKGVLLPNPPLALPISVLDNDTPLYETVSGCFRYRQLGKNGKKYGWVIENINGLYNSTFGDYDAPDNTAHGSIRFYMDLL